MSTLTFPSVTPTRSTFTYDGNVSTSRSWLTGFTQTHAFGGERLECTLYFENLQNADRTEMIGWIAEMNGGQNRVLVPVKGTTNRGAFGGSPIVAGANQVGTQLTIDGCSNNITNWVRKGDYVSFNQELKIITADADSDGSGNVTLSFRPRIRTSPSDNAAITTSNPTGRFLLLPGRVQWSYLPNGLSSLSVTLVEDGA